MNDRTFSQLDRRTAQIFQAVQVGTVPPNSDAVRELAELIGALEDQPVKPLVVARLTVVRALGNVTIIEVHSDATFSCFYHIFTQVGKRRSTKRLVRTASRNEGLLPYYRAYLMVPGLKVLAEHWSRQPGVSSVKIRIIKKRAYRQLLSARPDELGLTHTSVRLPLVPYPSSLNRPARSS
jgi:hypothetical protein